MAGHVPMCVMCGEQEVTIVVNSAGSGYCSTECEASYNEVDAEPFEEDCEPDESMDGDFDSGMASAGFGTDEDYGYYGDDF